MLKIISISGLDGSGKTTQADLLEKELRRRGEKVYRFHAVEYSLAQKASKPKSAGSSDTSVTKSGPVGIALRKLVLSVDQKRFKSFIKKLSAEGYTVLLADRYFYDNAINISYLEKSDSIHSINPVAPDFSFYIKVSPEAIMKRKRVADQGLEYLKTKYQLLEKFAKQENVKTIDGDQEPSAVAKEILAVIDRA